MPGAGGSAEGGIPVRSAHVDAGAAGAVGFGLAEDFAGDGGDFALAEEEEPEELGEGIAFGPLEVDVRPLSGHVARVQQQGGQRVGDGGTLQAEHAVAAVQDLAAYP